jgi:hypothetical protein
MDEGRLARAREISIAGFDPDASPHPPLNLCRWDFHTKENEVTKNPIFHCVFSQTTNGHESTRMNGKALPLINAQYDTGFPTVGYWLSAIAASRPDAPGSFSRLSLPISFILHPFPPPPIFYQPL